MNKQTNKATLSEQAKQVAFTVISHLNRDTAKTLETFPI